MEGLRNGLLKVPILCRTLSNFYTNSIDRFVRSTVSLKKIYNFVLTLFIIWEIQKVLLGFWTFMAQSFKLIDS